MAEENIETPNPEESEVVQEGLEETAQTQTEDISEQSTEQNQTEQVYEGIDVLPEVEELRKKLESEARQKAQFQGGFDHLTHKTTKEIEAVRSELQSIKDAIARIGTSPQQPAPPPDMFNNTGEFVEYLKGSLSQDLTQKQREQTEQILAQWQQQQAQQQQEQAKREQERQMWEMSQRARSEYEEIKKGYADRGTPIPDEIDRTLAQVIGTKVAVDFQPTVYAIMVENAMRKRGLSNKQIADRAKAQQQATDMLTQTQTADGTAPKPELKADAKKRLREVREILDMYD